ncbi:MAG TPA: response regulator [Candidatus Binatia bacterium]|jgi:DNA-binding response OmpR family regulator|nr:response regulator [Candidatus Binatia bacterium]
MWNKFLHVDDEPAWGLTVGTFLKLAGFRVVTAGSAAEAKVRADGGGLGAIILDVNLAGEDTVQLLKSLKITRPEAPVILYTGLEHDAEPVHRLMEQGADYYLRKGNLRALVECIQALARKLSPTAPRAAEPRAAEPRPRLDPLQTSAWQVV